MKRMTLLGSKRIPSRGFSLVEVVIALAVILILSAVAMPAFITAYRNYQLDDATTQFAGLLKFTRFEAIRLNKTVNCVIQQVASVPPVTNIWADSDVGGIPDGIEDPNEKQLIFSGTVNLVPPAAVPNVAGLAGAVGVATLADGTATLFGFDRRGAVNPANQVYAFYLANQGDTSIGSRAVVLLPSGAIQVWKADSLGTWISIS